MAFNYDNYPQNTKHCVIIDGNFGRHELFGNIHPFTLNRLGKSNNTFTFKMYSEQALNLMNDASNIHYHIFYNPFSVQIDEYFKILKMNYPHSVWLHPSEDSAFQFEEAIFDHQCDYIWIIHGIENLFQKQIAQLKSNNKIKAHIFSYCWLENLQNGSNRIEYLTQNKIKRQIEELNAQHVLNVPTTSSTQQKKPWKRIQCDIDDCKKNFKNVYALRDHQLAKHATHQSVISEAAIKSEEVIEKPILLCDFNGCRRLFDGFRSLRKHQFEMHSIPVQCPFSEECLNSNEKYLGIRALREHIILQHACSFPRRTCPIPTCKRQKHGPDWPTALQHILRAHARYLLNDDIPNINERKPTTDIPCWDFGGPYKCAYADCDGFYWDKKTLKQHEAFEHPVPLLCPFSVNCQRSGMQYIGFSNLIRHICSKHARMYSQPTCFDSKCKVGEEKPFKSWPNVLRHILKNHLNAVRLITESTTMELNISKKCSYGTCTQRFRTREEFQYHLVRCHPYPLRCPYSSQCRNPVGYNGKGYLGLTKLENHIRTEHPIEFQEFICFDSECQDKNFANWDQLVDHFLGKTHWLDIRL